MPNELSEALERVTYKFPYVALKSSDAFDIKPNKIEALAAFFWMLPKPSKKSSCALGQKFVEYMTMYNYTRSYWESRYIKFCKKHNIAMIPVKQYNSWRELNYPPLTILEEVNEQ